LLRSIKEGFCCDACEKLLPPEIEGGAVPCAKCGKILVGSVVQALGKEYHKDCFGCAVCGKLFAGGSFFTAHGNPVCEQHAND
jgi:ribosomal protein L37AE/L43A